MSMRQTSENELLSSFRVAGRSAPALTANMDLFTLQDYMADRILLGMI